MMKYSLFFTLLVVLISMSDAKSDPLLDAKGKLLKITILKNYNCE